MYVEAYDDIDHLWIFLSQPSQRLLVDMRMCHWRAKNLLLVDVSCRYAHAPLARHFKNYEFCALTKKCDLLVASRHLGFEHKAALGV